MESGKAEDGGGRTAPGGESFISVENVSMRF